MHTERNSAYLGTFSFQSKWCLWTHGVADNTIASSWENLSEWNLIFMLMEMVMPMVMMPEKSENKMSLENTLTNYQWLYLSLPCSQLETKKMETSGNEEPRSDPNSQNKVKKQKTKYP